MGKALLLEKIFVAFFSIFFIAQILSPMIMGMTIYLDLICVAINPYFWRWTSRKKIKYEYLIIIMCLLGMVVVTHAIVAVKIVLNLIYMMYFSYLLDRKLWQIDKVMMVSIFFSIAQMLLMFLQPELAVLIGPQNISQLLWGETATASWTNFYDALNTGMPRVSGLSREAGFMASLVVVMLFFDYKQSNLHQIRLSKKHLMLYIIGYICSFSKMSLIIIVVFMIDKIKWVLNKIPFGIIVIIWFVFMMLLFDYKMQFLLDPEQFTFLHRFGAYVAAANMDISQLLLGVDQLDKIDSTLASAVLISADNFAGAGGWLVSNGIFVVLLWVIIIYMLGVSSTGIILLLLFTINVQPDTNQNFVSMAYFLVYRFYRKNPIKM